MTSKRLLIRQFMLASGSILAAIVIEPTTSPVVFGPRLRQLE